MPTGRDPDGIEDMHREGTNRLLLGGASCHGGALTGIAPDGTGTTGPPGRHRRPGSADAVVPAFRPPCPAPRTTDGSVQRP